MAKACICSLDILWCVHYLGRYLEVVDHRCWVLERSGVLDEADICLAWVAIEPDAFWHIAGVNDNAYRSPVSGLERHLGWGAVMPFDRLGPVDGTLCH